MQLPNGSKQLNYELSIIKVSEWYERQYQVIVKLINREPVDPIEPYTERPLCPECGSKYVCTHEVCIVCLMCERAKMSKSC